MFQALARGIKPLVREIAGHGPPPGGGTGGRGFHSMPHANQLLRPRFTAAHAQRFLQSTRSAIRGVIQSIAGPAAHALPTEGVSLARSYARSGRTIIDGISPATRYVLSRPLGRPYLPRAPVVPRSIHEVGLGSARTFCTTRTVFHHVVENTSITTRAFLEADWDVHLRKEQGFRMAQRNKQKRTSRHSKRAPAPLKPIQLPIDTDSVADKDEELSHYFPVDAAPSVTTYLQVALAPTPSNRVPFMASYSDTRLLPLSVIMNNHQDFQTATNILTNIFQRLDESRSWEMGVTVESWGDLLGLCTELRVRFAGWSEPEVRQLLDGVLENEGQGWAIQEIREGQSDSLPESMMASLISTPAHAALPLPVLEMSDPWNSSSYVMPTLDFSSSFAQSPRALSNNDMLSDRQSVFDSDGFSVISSDNDAVLSNWGGSSSMESLPESLRLEHLSSNASERASRDGVSVTGWLSFSSDFAARVREGNDFYV